MASNATDFEYLDDVVQQAGVSGAARVFDLPHSLTEPLRGSTNESRLQGGRQAYAVAKLIFDLAVASVVLIVLLPLWLAIAATIVATSPGPVFFRQQRCGRGGRSFTCFKFRTMVSDAEAILHGDASLREAFAKNWKLTADPRVTRVGRWLRKTSLDEIPQLLNVLRGEMSLVGPRPVQPDELRDRYGHVGTHVLSVRPGLTGLWQVSGRSNVTYEERVALDVEYVRQRGFWFDLAIILRTIPAIIFLRGAV